MILNTIKEKLLEVDPVVYYGMVDKNRLEMAWDYTVFERSKITLNQNKSGFSHYFAVHVIRENFVPIGFEKTVIDKLCEIPGVRVAGDLTFQYVPKPNTNVVVEMLSIEFVLPVKG